VFWMSENCLESEDVLFEEALLDELFQVPSEAPTIDGLVSFTLVVGAYFSYPVSEGLCCIGFRCLTHD